MKCSFFQRTGILNVPLAAHSTDSDYAAVYKRLLLPLGAEFSPELILVSAGFDTHYDDPMGGMKLTEHGYAYMTAAVQELAEKTCGGRFAIMLEGGYDLGAMRKSCRAVLEVMMQGMDDTTRMRMEQQSEAEVAAHAEAAIGQVKENHRQYWNCFSHG
jgi:acetoin utilization deacetylase AcuC-like enzyme